jgi:hypothetical protein
MGVFVHGGNILFSSMRMLVWKLIDNITACTFHHGPSYIQMCNVPQIGMCMFVIMCISREQLACAIIIRDLSTMQHVTIISIVVRDTQE